MVDGQYSNRCWLVAPWNHLDHPRMLLPVELQSDGCNRPGDLLCRQPETLGPLGPANTDRVHEVTETEPSEDARPAQVEVLAARVAHARTSLVW